MFMLKKTHHYEHQHLSQTQIPACIFHLAELFKMERSILLASFTQETPPRNQEKPYAQKTDWIFSFIFFYLAYSVLDIFFFIQIKHILEFEMQ